MANQRKAKPPKDEPKDKEHVSLYEAQRRRTLAQAEAQEIKNREIAGELVRKSDVVNEYFNIGRQIRDAIENIPARLSGVLAAESDQQRIFALLSKELHQALEVLTK